MRLRLTPRSTTLNDLELLLFIHLLLRRSSTTQNTDISDNTTLLGYEPGGVFLPQGEFSTLFFTPMSPEHFLLVLQSGDWGVCEL